MNETVGREKENYVWNHRSIGSAQETKVQEHLETLGYKIVTRNFYSKHGEIDLIAKHNGYLVFIEVKYRADERFGAPEEAVTYGKQQRIIATAKYYMYKNRISFDTPCRFDVAGVQGEEIRITENAFWM